MLTNLSSLAPVLIGLAVVGLIVVRQFRPRRVNSGWTVLLPLGLAMYGATSLGMLDTTGLVVLAINTSLAVTLGVMRGMTLRIWSSESGEALMQSTSRTILLWVATIGVRVAISFVEQGAGLGTLVSGQAGLLIPLAATLGAQSVVAYLRSRDQQLVAA